MPQIGIADKQTLDKVYAEQGRVQTAGGWAGAVFDGCVLEDGKVKLETIFTVEQTAVNTQEPIYSGVYQGQSFTTIAPLTELSGFLFLRKIGVITDITITLKEVDVDGKPTGSVLGTTIISSSNISESDSFVPFIITGLSLKRNTKYCIYASMSGGDGYNCCEWSSYNASSTYSGGGRISSSDSGATWNVFDWDSAFKLNLRTDTTTGTASLDISPSSLYAWRNLYFKTKKPENTDIICAVKDTYDNVLIPNIADGGDLSSIDPTQYETLRLVWTLTRDSVEDESPELHEPSWSWLGGSSVFDLSEKTPTFVRFQTNLNTLQTVVDVEGGSGVAVVAVKSSDSTTRNARVVITVDGKILDDTSNHSLAYAGGGIMVYGVGGFNDSGIPNLGNYGIFNTTFHSDIPLPIVPTIGFKKSFKVEASTNSGQNIMVRVVVLA
jgi:hypothetical protein